MQRSRQNNRIGWNQLSLFVMLLSSISFSAIVFTSAEEGLEVYRSPSLEEKICDLSYGIELLVVGVDPSWRKLRLDVVANCPKDVAYGYVKTRQKRQSNADFEVPKNQFPVYQTYLSLIPSRMLDKGDTYPISRRLPYGIEIKVEETNMIARYQDLPVSYIPLKKAVGVLRVPKKLTLKEGLFAGAKPICEVAPNYPLVIFEKSDFGVAVQVPPTVDVNCPLWSFAYLSNEAIE